MKPAQRYTIVSAKFTDELIAKVERMLADGWQVAGGVFVFDSQLFQALVK